MRPEELPKFSWLMTSVFSPNSSCASRFSGWTSVEFFSGEFSPEELALLCKSSQWLDPSSPTSVISALNLDSHCEAKHSGSCLLRGDITTRFPCNLLSNFGANWGIHDLHLALFALFQARGGPLVGFKGLSMYVRAGVALFGRVLAWVWLLDSRSSSKEQIFKPLIRKPWENKQIRRHYELNGFENSVSYLCTFVAQANNLRCPKLCAISF